MTNGAPERAGRPRAAGAPPGAWLPGRQRIDLSAGPVEYLDTGGPGPCVVFTHGVLMNATLWREVITRLRPDHRCIAPTLPLGAHRLAMRPDADLSIGALAMLVAEFLDRLDLRDVTLVMNDWGGPQLLVEQGRTDRIGGLALVACEAFDNFPPGAPGRQLGYLARVPGGLTLLGLLARSARVRRAALGPMAKHPIPDALLTDWFTSLTRDAAVRRDLGRYIRSVPLRHRRDWSAGLAGFAGRALVVWAPEDQMMPPEHGPRLAALLPDSRLVELTDSHTLIPLDQPARLAAHLRDFVRPGRHETLDP